ncbi:hypothetical protein C8046_09805 [Serinibacter arcticus]|uniref:Uncharacterized protein n=1 Tax=Serinibacter arcticus TaxID=1655435 RepID=A0A2U1ZVD2_9MICO|nr:hypothetical protein [Serinibacter arcticus]PWD50903.1 hypothetical protein C8046_09805 [Serinibacter arcticus]
MPDPDDDVELPPAYDFTGGLPGFQPGAAVPPASAPATPAAPPATSGPPAAPSTPAPVPPAPAWNAPPSWSTPPPGAQPGARAPQAPGRRGRKRQQRGGPALYGTAPGTGGTGTTPPGVTPPGGTGRQPYAYTATGSTPPVAPPRKQRPSLLVGAAVAVVAVAVVVGSNMARDGADEEATSTGGSSSSPSAAPVSVPAAVSDVLWSVDVENDSLLVSDPMHGLRAGAEPNQSLVVVGDWAVGRFGPDPWQELEPTVLRAFSLEDGSAKDLLDVDRARCAPVDGALGRGSDLLTCAGLLDGDPSIVTLNVATGEEVTRWRVTDEVALIATTPGGVVTLDTPDLATGDTSLTWYTDQGLLRWRDDLDDLPADLAERFVEEYEGEYELGWSTDLVGVGDGAVLTLPSGVVALDPTGVTDIAECWSGAVLADAYVCEARDDSGASALTPTGEVLWTNDDLSLRTGLYERVPLLLASDYRSTDDGYESLYRVVDPTTGVPGPEILVTPDSVTLAGTQAVPVIYTQEERDDWDEPTVVTISVVDPATSQLLWTTAIDAAQYPTVVVAGDRVLVDLDNEGSRAVLDAATGDVLGSVTLTGRPAAVVDGGLLMEELFLLQRVELP